MSKEIKMRKLSDYNATEGVKVLSEVNRAIAPYSKDKKFMTKLHGCLDRLDDDNLEGMELSVYVDIIELITTSAPKLIFDIVAIMSGSDRKDIEAANLLDVVDAVMKLGDDMRFIDFLSSRFSTGASESASI